MPLEVDTRVNQKLYFSRLQLEQVAASEGRRGRQVAFIESFALHLYGALTAYLGELARYHGVEFEPAAGLKGLTESVRLAGKQAPEVAELARLGAQPSSWLGALIAYHDVCAFGRGGTVPEPGSEAQRLPLLSLSEPSGKAPEVPVPAPSDCRAWLDGFSELLERHRETMVEW
ncbi:MAG: DUF6586 family protein [Pseudomonadota bacterium]|nr:DUF6586 family protein [Pseudomonadota bacterium]